MRRDRDRFRPSKRPSRQTGSPPHPARRETERGGRAERAQPTAGAPTRLTHEIRAVAPPPKAERAVRAFEEAVELLGRGRDAAAVRAAEEAKSLASRSGAVREVLGLALYRTGRFRDALRELQAYRRITGRVDQNHLIADCHRALGNPEKAIEPAREALNARIPDEARAEAALVGAAALADLERFAEALAFLRAFPPRESARPHELRVWYVKGDILQRMGRRTDAANEFRRILRHDPSAFDTAERLAALSR